jgi:hypothetical protein
MSTKTCECCGQNAQGRRTQRSGFNAIKSWLGLSTSRDLHVGMIVCQNDDMANRARRAFEELSDTKERDAWLRLPITGCDGVPKAGQNWVRQGWLTATVAFAAAGWGPNAIAGNRAQPPEHTVVAPTSLPALSELKGTQNGIGWQGNRMRIAQYGDALTLCHFEHSKSRSLAFPARPKPGSLRLRSVENPHFSRQERARNGAPGIFIVLDEPKAHRHSGQALDCAGNDRFCRCHYILRTSITVLQVCRSPHFSLVRSTWKKSDPVRKRFT